MLLSLLAFIMVPALSGAQKKNEKKSDKQDDSLVRLVSADSLQLVEIRGVTYRRVVGRPARFLHNDTYLLCDSALWNVNEEIINAMGHVRIIQEQTELTSDKLTYFIQRDVAEFRGDLVQLRDKDKNTLRTRCLDYNTKDSVALFREGGALRDKDGQLIESINGTYDSKIKTFTFSDNVNMYTDSLFVKTTYLKYESDLNLATFGYDTNAWKDQNMLSANAGWYDRGNEKFFFHRNVHVMNDTQEGWSDSLYFKRLTSDVLMQGNAQVTDTTRRVHALAGKMDYVDSLSRLVMSDDPVVISEMDEEDENGMTQVDTAYVGADTLIYYTVKMCEVDSLVKLDAAERLKNVETDPVTTFRREAAEAAAKAAAEAAANDPNNPETAARLAAEAQAAKEAQSAKDAKGKESGGKSKKKSDKGGEGKSPAEVLDSLASGRESHDVGLDSLANASDSLVNNLDSLGTGLDSLAAADTIPAPDTTKMGFLHAFKNVRVFRKKMQVRCDSLAYCDLDSLARLYDNPTIWNEENHQYNADSVYVVVRNSTIDKANLMSNAFIHIQEDTLHYDQIKSAEMTAYFDENGALRRFDALGGAQALFYLEENDVLATVNKKESKMLSATFKEGEIQRILYFEEIKSDGYPVVQMTREEQTLKGFNWQGERRPKGPEDISSRTLRPSQRSHYAKVPHAEFIQTEKYFPGYMKDVYAQIAYRDSMRAVRQREKDEAQRRAEEEKAAMAQAAADSLGSAADSLAGAALEGDLQSSADSIEVNIPAVTDAPDTLVTPDGYRKESTEIEVVPRDTTSAGAGPVPGPTKEELKAQKKEQARLKKEQKDKEREEKWASQDAKDELKAKKRAEKKAAKLRKKKLAAIKAAMKNEQKELAELERYREKYRKEKDRLEQKAASSKKSRKDKKSKEVPDDKPQGPEMLSSVETQDIQDNL